MAVYSAAVSVVAVADEAGVLRKGALVYVMQGDTGSFGNASVFVDGKYIDKLTAITYLTIAVTPGVHEISTAGSSRVSVSITTRTGGRYYLWQAITKDGNAQITALSETQGERLLAGSRPLRGQVFMTDSTLAVADGPRGIDGAVASKDSDDGVYLGVSLGQSKVKGLSSAINDATVIIQADADAFFGPGVVKAVGTSDDSSVAAKLFVGYRFNQYVSTELMYARLAQFEAKISASSGGNTFSISDSWTMDSLGVTLVGDLPVSSQFALSARLGVVDTYTRDTSTVIDTTVPISLRNTQTAWDLSPFFGFGVRFNLSRSFSLRADYERYSKVGNNNKTGEFDIDMLTASAVYAF